MTAIRDHIESMTITATTTVGGMRAKFVLLNGFLDFKFEFDFVELEFVDEFHHFL